MPQVAAEFIKALTGEGDKIMTPEGVTVGGIFGGIIPNRLP
jgi:hypothetical protein